MNPPSGGRGTFYSSRSGYPPYSGGDWRGVGHEEREEYWTRYDRGPPSTEHFYPTSQGYYSGCESYYPPVDPPEWHSFDTTDPHFPPSENIPAVSCVPPPTTDFSEDVQVMWRSCDQDDQANTDSSAEKALIDYKQHKTQPPLPLSSAESSSNAEVHDTSSDIAATEVETVDSKFQKKVEQFVVKHEGLIATLLRDVDGKNEECSSTAINSCGDWYADPDPLEYHMGIHWKLRRQKFFELVAPSDIIRGHVMMTRPHGVFVRVTSFKHSFKNRELTDLKIKGLVIFENLAETKDKCKKLLEELQEEDVVQAVVTGVDNEEYLVELSFQQNHLPSDKQDVKLGYLEGRKPLNPRSSMEDNEYLRMLRDEPGFSNPDCVENLKSVLGLPANARYTLMRPILMNEFPESEHFESLRRVQRRKWSMETVATGVKHFKAGDLSAALKYFNHALEIDGKNVEGLVARGALHANQNRFREGITDFETALTINHTHRNAKNYLVETQVAYGKKLEEQGRLESALSCYKEALADNPESEAAKNRAAFITTILQRQAAEKKEKERKQEEEEARLRKLKKIIEKERRREKRRGESSEERKRKHHDKKKRKTSNKKQKRKYRHYYSSEDSGTDSSNSHRSRSVSPAPPSSASHRR